MELLIEINIPASRSPVHKQVVTIAKKTGYYNSETGKLIFDSIIELWRLWDDFSFVLWQSQNWSGFYVRLNGKLILPYSNHWFYTLLDIQRCYFTFTSEIYKDEFCSIRCFGCRKLMSIMRNIEPGLINHQIWYRYGYFSDDLKYWIIDKAVIIRQLLSESVEFLPACCPEFSDVKVMQMVSLLPDKIELDEFWEIEYDVRIHEKGIVNFPVNVRCKLELINVDAIKPKGGPLVVSIGKVPNAESTNDEINKYLDELSKQKNSGNDLL